MTHDNREEQVREALDRVARVRLFVTTRERIKQPEGSDLFDLDLATIRAHIEALEAQLVEAGKSWEWWHESALVCGRQRDAAEARVRELEGDAARLLARYTWAANELLACDHGDNLRGEVGWIVYGWRPKGQTPARIYGPSIDAAIDSAMQGEEVRGG